MPEICSERGAASWLRSSCAAARRNGGVEHRRRWHGYLTRVHVPLSVVGGQPRSASTLPLKNVNPFKKSTSELRVAIPQVLMESPTVT